MNILEVITSILYADRRILIFYRGSGKGLLLSRRAFQRKKGARVARKARKARKARRTRRTRTAVKNA